MMIHSCKDLIVWQRSMELVKEIYLITEKLPKNEQFGLISQMRRCAVSIPSNIAEGKARRTGKDFMNFLHIAHGSVAELFTQLSLVKTLFPGIIVNRSEELIEEVERMLVSLRQSIGTKKY